MINILKISLNPKQFINKTIKSFIQGYYNGIYGFYEKIQVISQMSILHHKYVFHGETNEKKSRETLVKPGINKIL